MQLSGDKYICMSIIRNKIRYFVLILRVIKISICTNIILLKCRILYGWKSISVGGLIKTIQKRNDVCHILGSGWSLTQGLGSIRDDDFVIGFNFSGIAYQKSDLYFIELATDDMDRADASCKQYELWKTLNAYPTVFVFKNILEKYNKISMINDNYGKNVVYLKDAVVGCEQGLDEDEFVDFLFSSEVFFFKNQAQSISTTILCIILAYRAGFKKIILHGVDFFGAHFYENTLFANSKFAPNTILKNKSSSMHQTNSEYFSHSSVLCVMKKKLEQKGVLLISATSASPSGFLLGVYQD